ncbi:transcriptional repressor [Paenibacillus sp. GD4]|jgi:Fur family transcriptional regulator, peroxide stress response regulator|uniref:Fur family transcriptional regulator n=1 Tax=Paenibacillus sp. GD4 TaxID=3068890 RepID=UPI00279672AC|nr:transcriptional repressor [Paenibacillus sp. GD4]MDQ1911817.1 transcriptional repressor [Paenibacillus sp. GD4]
MRIRRSEAEAALDRAGVRRTTQRQLLLEYLYEKLSHPSAEQLHRAIYQDFPREVSMPTVYKNLKVLNRLGLVQEFYLHGSSVARYDTDVTAHHHLVCMDCGSVEDYYAGPVAGAVAATLGAGFEPVQLYMEISGRCKECMLQKAIS